MSISDIFNVANTGINASRLAIEVTGENIANVNTEGYSRQRVILATAPPIREIANYSLGSGVKLDAIQRSYDALLQKQITDAGSGYSQTLTEQDALHQTEPLFNEITTDGLGKSVQDFFDSWQDLSLNPQGSPERQAVMSRAEIMIDTFHQTNASLENIRTNADKSLVDITASITETSRSIASLNEQIQLSEMSGGNANELRDKRDLAVRELADKVGISYFEEPTGALSISLPDGQQLVSGGGYATLYTYPNAKGLNDIYITTVGNPPAERDPLEDRNITSLVSGDRGTQGEIGGTLQVRDVIVPDMLGQIDELAYVMSSQVDALHVAGWGLNSTTGKHFFDISGQTVPGVTGSAPSGSDLFTVSSTSELRPGMSVSEAGGNIPANAIITEILSPTTFKISAKTTPAAVAAGTTLVIKYGYSGSITISDDVKNNLNNIAAANTDPLIGGPGNNKNALAIAQLSSADSVFSTGTTSIISFYSAIVSKVGIDTQATDDQAAREEAYTRQLGIMRESQSGVSLDEELTNLIKYQKAFEGNAKMITTATEMMDIVLGLVR